MKKWIEPININTLPQQAIFHTGSSQQSFLDFSQCTFFHNWWRKWIKYYCGEWFRWWWVWPRCTWRLIQSSALFLPLTVTHLHQHRGGSWWRWCYFLIKTVWTSCGVKVWTNIKPFPTGGSISSPETTNQLFQKVQASRISKRKFYLGDFPLHHCDFTDWLTVF